MQKLRSPELTALFWKSCRKCHVCALWRTLRSGFDEPVIFSRRVSPALTQRTSLPLPPRLTLSYLCTTTGGSAGTLAERRATWPAWWLKGCRRLPSEEEWCWIGGRAKPGGESERSCSPSRCALRGYCWGSSWDSSRWHGKQVRGSLTPSLLFPGLFCLFMWSLAAEKQTDSGRTSDMFVF